MSDIQTFKSELREAGQPWSKWGIWIAGAGLLVLLFAQVSPIIPNPFAILGLAIALIATGWVMLVIAFVKRRRWARANPLEAPSMPDLS